MDDAPEHIDAAELLRRYGVENKYYRFTIDDGSDGTFIAVGEGLTEEAAFDALVKNNTLSPADYDYIEKVEEISQQEWDNPQFWK